jgi:hypothetical protein
VTTAQVLHETPPSPRAAASSLWFALAAGPAAASLNLGIGYALVKPSCAGGSARPRGAVAACSALVALGGAWMGLVRFLDIGTSREEGQPWTRDSRRLLAVVAIALDLLLTLFIVATAVAMAVLSPCE